MTNPFYSWQKLLSRVGLWKSEKEKIFKNECEIKNNSSRFNENLQNKKITVFFDVDDTLINGQTQKLMISYFYQKKKINLTFLLKIYFWFLLYKIGFVSSGTSLMSKAYKLTEGIKVEEFKNFMLDLFKKRIKSRIYPQAIERINFHKQKGHEIVLLSKSCKILIDIIKDYLDVPLSFATELEVKNGTLTGKINGPIVHGEEKLKIVEKLAPIRNWNLKESYAYGDHYSDLPLLKAVGHPCVVNPAGKLKKEAEKNNWSIFYWRL
jgi:HAD superfamily hydrolase (TIGR01490 family)